MATCPLRSYNGNLASQINGNLAEIGDVAMETTKKTLAFSSYLHECGNVAVFQATWPFSSWQRVQMNLTSRFQGNVAFEKIDGNLAVLCGNVAYLATWPCIQIRPLLTTWSRKGIAETCPTRRNDASEKSPKTQRNRRKRRRDQAQPTQAKRPKNQSQPNRRKRKKAEGTEREGRG